MKRLLLACTALCLTISSAVSASEVAPFGQQLFTGYKDAAYDSSLSNPNRTITFGDRLLVRMWGAKNYENVVMVDADGAIFIPEVGPINIFGKTLSDAQSTITSAVGAIYNDNVKIHSTIAQTQPQTIYVTGNVANPGRYFGQHSDTVIDYLARAGGIDPNAGSYRSVSILKATSDDEVAVDLYRFLNEGYLPNVDIVSGDRIHVSDRAKSVSVHSGASKTAEFEFTPKTRILGKNLLELTKPDAGMTHARIVRTLATGSETIYLTLSDFAQHTLRDGDEVTFTHDAISTTMEVEIVGEVIGQQSYSVMKGSSLKELLSFIKVDPTIVDTSAIHIERASVAAQQRADIERSLIQLQRRLALSQPASPTEAQMRASESNMVTALAETIKNAEFTGKVVLEQGGKMNDVVLLPGDKIIVPSWSDTVSVSGEVIMSNAVVFKNGMTVLDYIALSGGMTPNANQSEFIIKKSNGRSIVVGQNYQLSMGDNIIVLPKVTNKSLAIAGDVIAIAYQVAMGTRAFLLP